MSTIAEKTDINQISLTGVRALIFIGLLMIEPQSFEDVKKTLIDFKVMNNSISDDTLRVDLNTIKAIGCEVIRSSKKTGKKYKLLKHPFALKIPDEELNVLKKVYKYARVNADFNTILNFHKLFEKIAIHICDEETKEALLGISILKYYNMNIINELIEDCKFKNIVQLVYKKPNVAKILSKEIIAQKIVYKNDKVYLYGQDFKKRDPIILNLRRLRSIIGRRKLDNNIEVHETIIKFLLKNIKENDLGFEEEIIEKLNEGYIIEGHYHNDFIAMQKILSLGDRCIVIEPIDFKNKIVDTIKEMRKTYDS